MAIRRDGDTGFETIFRIIEKEMNNVHPFCFYNRSKANAVPPQQ